MSEATISLADDPRAGREGPPPDEPALVVAWSADEPWRVGEVAFVGPLGAGRVLGRGDDGEPDRLSFFRQRPGLLEPAGPVEGRAISRRQLLVRRFAAGLEVERIGRCALAVNGAPVDRAAVFVGDTVLLRGQLLLYCASRSAALPAPVYFHARWWGAFGEPDAATMLGESPAMWRLRERLAFAARSDAHVLLSGESGTGKELAARAIHSLSNRARGELVARSAATFPAGLIDAELFGNMRGYPNPGAPERPGLVGQAHGGTLFLDEIGELPHDLQAHLLRVLDAGGEYHRLGEPTARRSDLRLVGATNRPLGALKHDLRARLTVRVELEPLSARREDIPLLLRHMVLRAAARSPDLARRFIARAPGREEPRLEPELVEMLLRREYPGNVRELDAILLRAMGESPGDAVALPEEKAPSPEPTVPSSPPAEGGPREPEPTEDQIRACLAREQGNVRRAADALGLPSRYALYRLLRRYGIDPKRLAAD